MRFTKQDDFCFSEVQAIIVKKTKKKSKNTDKKVKLKIINCFLVGNSISSCLYKSQKIVYYYQNITPVSNPIKQKNRFNPVYFYHCPRFETENESNIGTNFSKSIQLAGFISLTKPLYIINSSWPISLILYFIKYKLA